MSQPNMIFNQNSSMNTHSQKQHNKKQKNVRCSVDYEL